MSFLSIVLLLPQQEVTLPACCECHSLSGDQFGGTDENEVLPRLKMMYRLSTLVQWETLQPAWILAFTGALHPLLWSLSRYQSFGNQII